MKKIFFSVLLLPAASAFAQDAVKPSTAAPAAAQKPPRFDSYSPAIQRTMKNLSVLLERGAEVPPERLEALAPELAAFNEKVKEALGPDILAAVARRERELEDKERSAKALRTLQAFRAALQVYYGEKGGEYPKSPAQLVPAMLSGVPELLLPEHDRTSGITVIDSKKYDKDFSRAVTDSGGWLYFSNPGSDNYGLLVLDCSHAEAGGTEFFRY